MEPETGIPISIRATGNHLVHIVEINLLQTLQHQNANIDQRCGSSSCGDDCWQIVSYYRQEITRFLELETVTNMDMRRILNHISVNKDGSVGVVLKKFEEMAVA